MGEGTYYEFEKRYFVGSSGVKWENESISAGDETRLEDIERFDDFTVFFRSDTAGTLTFQTTTPAGTRRTFDSYSISADTLEPFTLTAVVDKIGLKFDSGARVEAWFFAKMKKYYK